MDNTVKNIIQFYPIFCLNLSQKYSKWLRNALYFGYICSHEQKKKVKTLRSFGLRTYLSDSISWWFPPTLFPWHIGSAIKSCVFICSHNQLFSTFVGFSHNSVELVLATTTAGIDHPRITEAQPSY